MIETLKHNPTYAWNKSRAVIDIGSNTVRLVVYGGPPRAPVVLLNEKVTAKLGKGVAEVGKLSGKATANVLAALARYKAIIDLGGIGSVDVVATAAVRDASNGQQFLERVRALGFAPRLLSGVEEAETSATGVIGAFPDARGIVGDLGGGSLELVDVADGGTSHGVSMPLGSLRLPALRAGGDRTFARKVGAMLAKADWAAEPGVTLYLVGGSMRAFARAVMVRMNWPVEDTHGFTLDAAKALDLARLLSRRGQAIKPIDGVSTNRLASIPDTAALVAILLRQLSPARIVFSSWGLREGVLFSALSASEQKLHPLVSGVGDFVTQLGITAAEGDAAVRWMQDVAPMARTPLGQAAVLLCLAAGRVEPNLRRETPRAWALRKRWIGVETSGRAILAAALQSSVSRGGSTDDLAVLAPNVDLGEAQTLGLAARLCRRLTAGCVPLIEHTALRMEAGKLSLESVEPALIGDAALRDLKELAQHMGLQIS
ncbi:Ppx/GppA family phosphatase [Novosphingobium sp. CECT 9465]|uniref:Ppx/GppA family phosphatase n=1 Tax=Novosphingobium sp. CECT 9465 TaxID=2829794 RepID=UPI001E50EA12|nr:Ppx/GppA family phosphatase [Novosphingobium sp. CECT 9465]CAH0497176.1 Guanosine-5'-triphosphate,3'-diphosphate pyrophosphatase [Novosphingobium sp. CECT 9465]